MVNLLPVVWGVLAVSASSFAGNVVQGYVSSTSVRQTRDADATRPTIRPARRDRGRGWPFATGSLPGRLCFGAREGFVTPSVFKEAACARFR